MPTVPITPRDPNERIDDLESDLYSRDAQPITTKKRPNLSPHEKLVEYGWKEEPKKPPTIADFQVEEPAKKGSFVTKVFLASVLFFVVAAGIAAYIILGGFNVISSKNVDITVQGLIAVSAGEELSLDIKVKNNNNTTLDSGTIYIEYPEGTRSPTDVTQDLVRDQVDFDTVLAGGSVTKTVKAVFFGEKDSVQQIKITVEYKARGSNAIFSKIKTYDVTIKSSPILMEVEVPEEVNAGQEIAITVDVASNSATIVRNLAVKVEYPFGFTFISAKPEATFDKNIWRLGDLSPQEKRTIVIRGRMDGQNEEERTFRFMTGTASESDDRALAINYIATQESLFIKKSFISLSLELNGRPSPYLATAGEKIQGRLIWSNNLPIAINDAEISIKLSGRGLDRGEVEASSGGFFRSVDNTLNWDKNSLPLLQSLEPGETDSVGFTIAVPPATQQLLSQGRNMDIVLDGTVKGIRIQSGAPGEVQSTISGLAKVATNLVLDGKVVHSIGPFQNTGSVPPRAERETTYSVVLDLSNSFNDVANVVVSMVLPPHVRWLSVVSPATGSLATEQVAYDESTRTVTWSVPDLRAGVGYTIVPKEVAFQIALLPSLSQLGMVPDLTGPMSVTGLDRFTGTALQSNKPALTTRMSTDPAFRSGDERVER